MASLMCHEGLIVPASKFRVSASENIVIDPRRILRNGNWFDTAWQTSADLPASDSSCQKERDAVYIKNLKLPIKKPEMWTHLN
jgi:hypothetical protein